MEGQKVVRKKSIMYISLSDDESEDERHVVMAMNTDTSSGESCVATSESENEARNDDNSTAAARNMENFNHNAANNEQGVYDDPPLRLPRIPRQSVLKTRRVSATDATNEHPRRKSSIRRTRKYSDFTLYKTYGSEGAADNICENDTTKHDDNVLHELSSSPLGKTEGPQDNEQYLVRRTDDLHISD